MEPEQQEVAYETEVFKYVGMAIPKPIEGGVNAKPVTDLNKENSMKHGYGVEINKVEGTRYEGFFKHDKHHGKGKLVYELTGDRYNG